MPLDNTVTKLRGRPKAVAKAPKKAVRGALLEDLPPRANTALVIPALTEAEKAGKEIIRITRPNIRQAVITIRGMPDSPYCQHAFSEKARKQMEETQRAGQQARGRRNRKPKDFEAVYEAAKHHSEAGWIGIPCGAFRNASISVCKLLGFKMTHAKLSLFVLPDGKEKESGKPLVRIYGEPRISEEPVRNQSGVADIRWRPMWDTWHAKVRIEWDEDQFSATDIYHLFLRAGWHVGVGEGRPDSPNSNGLGWGRFDVDEPGDEEE